jgi:hypothetical protein
MRAPLGDAPRTVQYPRGHQPDEGDDRDDERCEAHVLRLQVEYLVASRPTCSGMPVSTPDVSAMSGHAKVSTTLNIYGHAIPSK